MTGPARICTETPADAVDRDRHGLLATLREQVRRIECDEHAVTNENISTGCGSGDRLRRVPTGWPNVDAVLDGGLAIGRLHEWLGVCDAVSHKPAPDQQRHRTRHHWRPPLTLMAHLAGQTVASTHHHTNERAPREHAGALILWIGARCRPFWPMLARLSDMDQSCDLVHQSIFVSAQDSAERVWATDLALRCPAVAAVIVDAGGFKRAETRRLQLAAENGSALALLVRPPNEQRELTTASTRWFVAHQPSSTRNPQWTVRLLRCKGVRPTVETAHAWLLEWAHEAGAVRPLADVLDRSDVATHSPIRAQSTDTKHQRRSA